MSSQRRGTIEDKRAFARELFGMDDKELALAYARVKGRDKPTKSDHVQGSRWGKDPDVINELERLNKRTETPKVLKKIRKRELLCGIAEDEDEDTAVRIKAMSEDSKLAGHYEPEKVESNSVIHFDVINALRDKNGLIKGYG